MVVTDCFDVHMVISELAGTGSCQTDDYLRYGGNWHYNIFPRVVLEAAN